MAKLPKVLVFFLAGAVYAWAATSLGSVSSAYFDSAQYLQYGKNLIEEGYYGFHTKPDMNREPGYGIYLAGIIFISKITGLIKDLSSLSEPHNVFWIKWIQSLFLYLVAGICAFRCGFPNRLQKPFFFLLVLSPTSIGAMREIYSEALSIPLSVILLCTIFRSLSNHSLRWQLLSGLFFGAAVLTKSYLYYASWAFLLVLVATLIGTLWKTSNLRSSRWQPLNRPIFGLLLCLFLGGFSAQQIWNSRNTRVFGQNVTETRLSIAIAGKVARLDRAEWTKDLLPAIAASLGTNFCDKFFDPERCSLYDYRGCDVIGNEVRVDYESRFPTKSAADRALKHAMIALWFERPVTQLFGSGLELLRMFFFEAFLDAGTLPSAFFLPARAWHILGSLLFWGLILVSLTRHRRHWTRISPAERYCALFCLFMVAYHATTMAQITNVVRYVFPILPFLYYFVADGISVLIERKRSWIAHPKMT